jgi:hypothetical protein
VHASPPQTSPERIQDRLAQATLGPGRPVSLLGQQLRRDLQDGPGGHLIRVPDLIGVTAESAPIVHASPPQTSPERIQDRLAQATLVLRSGESLWSLTGQLLGPPGIVAALHKGLTGEPTAVRGLWTGRSLALSRCSSGAGASTCA